MARSRWWWARCCTLQAKVPTCLPMWYCQYLLRQRLAVSRLESSPPTPTTSNKPGDIAIVADPHVRCRHPQVQPPLAIAWINGLTKSGGRLPARRQVQSGGGRARAVRPAARTDPHTHAPQGPGDHARRGRPLPIGRRPAGGVRGGDPLGPDWPTGVPSAPRQRPPGDAAAADKWRPHRGVAA
eukprot:9227291-Pyramimonas_sp.AAC.1